jgi:hypothetical protein
MLFSIWLQPRYGHESAGRFGCHPAGEPWGFMSVSELIHSKKEDKGRSKDIFAKKWK